MLLIPVVLNTAYHSLLLPALHMDDWSLSEAMSIPFQQSARYAVKHDKDVTEEEKDVLNSVLNYEELKKEYNPEISDPVKNLYHGNNELLKNYLVRVWMPQFLRHPMTYLDATATNTYHFFDPDAVMALGSRNDFFSYGNENELHSGKRDAAFIQAVGKRVVRDYGLVLESAPIIGLTINTAVLLWFIVYLFFRAMADGFRSRWKKSGKEALLLVPSIITILMCAGSPCFINNGNRYSLPIAWTAWFLAGVCLYGKQKEVRNGRQPGKETA